MVENNGPVGLPIIDISSFVDRPGHTDEQRQELATLWDETMTNKGFAIVVGHGVTEDLVMRLRNASEKFFNLPQEEKEKFQNGQYGNNKGGFTCQGVEAVGNTLNLEDDKVVETEASPPDLVEAYSVHGRPEQWGAEETKDKEAFPPLPQTLDQIVREYYTALEKVLYTLNTMSA